MITFEQAKQLKHGHIIYSNQATNADGSPMRWRISGKVKLWKTRPYHIKVPIKHGLYDNSYLDHHNLDVFEIDENIAHVKMLPNVSLSVYNYTGRNTDARSVTVGPYTFYFSYQTIVGFYSDEGLILSENVWSNTTGRHINEIGDVERTPRDEFELKLKEFL